MTTIIATSRELVGDTFVSYSPSFKGDPKIWIAKGCAWGGAGGGAQLSQFRLWTQGKAKRPDFKKPDSDEEDTDAKLEVLELHPKNGIFLWINADLPDGCYLCRRCLEMEVYLPGFDYLRNNDSHPPCLSPERFSGLFHHEYHYGGTDPLPPSIEYWKAFAGN